MELSPHQMSVFLQRSNIDEITRVLGEDGRGYATEDVKYCYDSLLIDEIAGVVCIHDALEHSSGLTKNLLMHLLAPVMTPSLEREIESDCDFLLGDC